MATPFRSQVLGGAGFPREIRLFPRGGTLLPGQEYRIVGPDRYALHLAPDHRLNAVWVQTVNLAAAVPDGVGDVLDRFPSRTAAMGACALAAANIVAELPPNLKIEPDALFEATVRTTPCATALASYLDERSAAIGTSQTLRQVASLKPSVIRPDAAMKQRAGLQLAQQLGKSAVRVALRR